MAARNSKGTKTVQILARYTIKASGSIVYAVRNGENKEYCVTLNSNGSTGCVERSTGEECKGHKYAHRAGHDCHHVTHCQATEEARVAAPAAEVVACAMAEALEQEREEEVQTGIEHAVKLDDAEYAQWKREMGLDCPMSAQEIEMVAAYELKYAA